MVIKSKAGINDVELLEALKKSIENKQLKKVLLLPPDHTRLYSGAGKICAMYYNLLKNTCEIDIMPALSTRKITKEEVEGVSFKYIPYEEAAKRYDITKLVDGYNTVDGEEIFYISNPALGLWATKDGIK